MRFDLPPGYRPRVLEFLAQGLDLEGGARQELTAWKALNTYQKRSPSNKKARIAKEMQIRQFKLILELLRRIPRNATAWVECDWRSIRALGIYWTIPGRWGGRGRAHFVLNQDEWRTYEPAAPAEPRAPEPIPG